MQIKKHYYMIDKSKLLALLLFIVGETLMIIKPFALYLSGSFFFFGYMSLVVPYINKKIDKDLILYSFNYLITVLIYFRLGLEETRIDFIILFSVYLAVLTYLTYQTRDEEGLFKWIVRMLFVSDTLFGFNMICRDNREDWLMLLYAVMFFVAVGLLGKMVLNEYHKTQKIQAL